MYSINFDFFFNLVYNFLLAIRYAFLFWILRIDPKDYLADHKYDAWDGLRDRGWISAGSTNPISTTAPDLGSTSVYLGSVNNTSWWDVLKSQVFGSGVNNKFISYSGDMKGYNAANPADVNFAAQQVNNDPWFYGLHFSIQNPILAFCADIISTFAFFILLIFIYTMFQWLFITFASKRKEREKARLAKIEARRKILRERSESISKEEEIEIQKENKERERRNIMRQREIAIEKREQDPISWWDGDLPEGLPIDEEELNEEEKEAINENKNNLLNYSQKNKDINKNNLIKISDLDDNKKEESGEAEKKQKDYKNRWDIVLNYANGKDEALWRVGILEADNMLNDLLVDRGYEGATVADRLSNANFNTLDLAWAAHKIRNRIAHDGSRFVITDRIARNTFDLFKAVFTEFKIFE